MCVKENPLKNLSPFPVLITGILILMKWKNVKREDSSVTFMSKGDFIVRFNQWDTNQEVYLPYQNNKEKFYFDNFESLLAFKEQVDNALKLIREK